MSAWLRSMSSTRKMSEHPSPPYNHLPGEAAAVAEAAEAATEFGAEVAEVAAAAEVAWELGSDGAGDHKRT